MLACSELFFLSWDLESMVGGDSAAIMYLESRLMMGVAGELGQEAIDADICGDS